MKSILAVAAGVVLIIFLLVGVPIIQSYRQSITDDSNPYLDIAVIARSITPECREKRARALEETAPIKVQRDAVNTETNNLIHPYAAQQPIGVHDPTTYLPKNALEKMQSLNSQYFDYQDQIEAVNAKYVCT